MPYVSDAQRKFMHAKHPEIAARWDEKYGGKIQKKSGRAGAIARRLARRHNKDSR